MILYENRKFNSEVRKAFIESVYDEGENLFTESMFKDADDFQAFMDTVVKPQLDGWDLLGDISEDDEGNVRDDVILYKETPEEQYCVITASLMDGKPAVEPKYSIEVALGEDDEDKFSFESDDLEEFISTYNSLIGEKEGLAFGLGGEKDPLKALISYVGRKEDKGETLRRAMLNKSMNAKEEPKPEENEMKAEPAENNSEEDLANEENSEEFNFENNEEAMESVKDINKQITESLGKIFE